MVWTCKKGRRQFVELIRGGKDWKQTVSGKAQEKVESMFDRGYEDLGNK